MKTLLLLIMIHEVDIKVETQNNHTRLETSTLLPLQNPACQFTNNFCCKETDNVRVICPSENQKDSLPPNFPSITNDFPETLGNETALDIINRLEKEAIHNIMEKTNYSTDYNFGGLNLTVVVMNLTNILVPVTVPKVSNTAPTKQILNPVEAYRFYYFKLQFHVSDQSPSVQTLIPVEAFQNISEAVQKVGIVIYNSIQQFNTKNYSIMSKVIRVEVIGRDIVNLTNPLIIHFPVNNYTNHSAKSYKYSCQYYDEHGSNTWKTDGCNTTQISVDVVECSCDHMTAFAVLLVEVNNIDGQHWEILSYISYVGCGLSAFFSACTVLLFIFSSNARAEVSNSIHVSLSAALFLLNLSFMFSEWAATLTVNEVCVFIAVMIHYSLLCSFTWMAIEAMHLYLLLIRVFNINIRHYMVKLSLIGWGVPAVLVGSLMSVQQLTHTFYGARNVTLLNSKATNPVCWITEPLILYGVNLSYFTIIFVFNTVVLITVSRQIFKLRKLDNKNKKIPVKDASTVLGLMCLLGTSWGLVFLGYGYTSYPILYIFCISNTVQGFSIFLWMCRTARPEKQKEAHSKSLSTLDTFIIEKQ
ncbi:adhesion G-protein coupled receptor G5-like [Carassius auratus]|uniref:Adhesion G-protein coupled receptor G5-like n=1 Tax=Carassius auratus TaxID=7957 RepID=A0A6P6KKI9_CARAU|nr:adhesion G-protein coupled receptor G5-like [Carassius auratus]